MVSKTCLLNWLVVIIFIYYLPFHLKCDFLLFKLVLLILEKQSVILGTVTRYHNGLNFCFPWLNLLNMAVSKCFISLNSSLVRLMI